MYISNMSFFKKVIREITIFNFDVSISLIKFPKNKWKIVV